MKSRNIIERLVTQESISSVLKRNSTDKESVKALQFLLHDLGFGRELNWERYGADGDYGGGTTQAVKAFSSKNDLDGNGEVITPDIAKKLLDRYDILDDLRHVYDAVQRHKVEEFYFRGSSHQIAVVVLQTLLNELGFGEQLKWARFGADGDFGGGTTKALRAFAKAENIRSNGRQLTEELAQKILEKLQVYFGADWAADVIADSHSSGDLQIRQVVQNGKRRLYITLGDVTKRFVLFRKGAYTFGSQKAFDFIQTNMAALLSRGLTKSAVNVIVAVSENEGNLDAINTWDNSFMTFGMFQWTLGTASAKGELPALLKKIKTADPDVFERYYGQYGLDCIQTRSVYGYCTLDGRKLQTPSDKELLRSPEWVFRFWLSGQDPVVQRIEIEHSLSRLQQVFSLKVMGHPISEIVKSEYGVGLLLDNHVNRPGYVKACLRKAFDQTGLEKPGGWGTDEERRLIDAYLVIRETHGRNPMTDARKRATVTQRYVENGTISAERGSFQFMV